MESDVEIIDFLFQAPFQNRNTINLKGTFLKQHPLSPLTTTSTQEQCELRDISFLFFPSMFSATLLMKSELKYFTLHQRERDF